MSIAAAGAIALCVACVQAAPRESVSAAAPVASGAVASRVGPVAPPAPAPGQEALRAGPLGALSQMVTTQALLVSLFLAPVSKDGSQMMARADASAHDGGTRTR